MRSYAVQDYRVIEFIKGEFCSLCSLIYLDLLTLTYYYYVSMYLFPIGSAGLEELLVKFISKFEIQKI